MLDQGDRRRGPVWNRVAEIPDRVVVEDVAVLELLRAGDRGTFHAFIAFGAETDKGADDRSELLGFVLVEVTLLQNLDLSVLVLLHQEEIDQPCDLVLPQP